MCSSCRTVPVRGRRPPARARRDRGVSRRGRPTELLALAVSGPAGIGKTTVWEAGVDLAADRGRRVLVARPAGVEASLSFAGLGRPLRSASTTRRSTLLPAPQRRALAAALLRDDPSDGRIDPRALATATATAPRELRARSRFSSRSTTRSGSMLRPRTHSTSRSAAPIDTNVGVLCSVRTDAGRPDTFETALPEIGGKSSSLTPLTVAALHEVIRARLGRSLPRPTVVKIVERTGGNTFYALEIARELVRQRRGRAPASFRFPPARKSSCAANVERLPARDPRCPLLASALGGADDGRRIGRRIRGRRRQPASSTSTPPAASTSSTRCSPLRSTSPHRRDGGVTPIASWSTARTTRRRVPGISHSPPRPRTRPSPRRSTPPRRTPPREAPRPPRPSWHASRWRRLPKAPTRRGRGERSRSPTTSSMPASRPRRALRWRPSTHTSVHGDLRAQLLRDLGYCLWYEGEREAGYRLVLDALEHARDHELAARTHAAAAWLWHDGDLDRGDRAHRCRGRAARSRRSIRGRTPGRSCSGRTSDSSTARATTKRPIAAAASCSSDRSTGTTRARCWGCGRSSTTGSPRRAASTSAASSGRKSAGDVTSVQGTLVRLAEIACWTGDWADADRLADECMALADRTASSVLLGSSLYARGLVDAHLGRLDEARAAGRGDRRHVRDRTQGALGHWLLGFVALSLDDAETADREYTRAQAIVDAQGQSEPARYRFQPDHIEAVVELGDVARARTMPRSSSSGPRSFPRPWILGDERPLPRARRRGRRRPDRQPPRPRRKRSLSTRARNAVRARAHAARAGQDPAAAEAEARGTRGARRGARRCSRGSAPRGGRRPATPSCAGWQRDAPPTSSRRPNGGSPSSPPPASPTLRSPPASRVAEDRRGEPRPGLPEARHLVVAPNSARRSPGDANRFRRELPLSLHGAGVPSAAMRGNGRASSPSATGPTSTMPTSPRSTGASTG